MAEAFDIQPKDVPRETINWRYQRKPWSGSYRVCILLGKGLKCKLHGNPEVPLVCAVFNCEDSWQLSKANYKHFYKFRDDWREYTRGKAQYKPEETKTASA